MQSAQTRAYLAASDLRWVGLCAPPHRRHIFRGTGCGHAQVETAPSLITHRQESIDIGQVAHALSNGLRSDVEIAKTTRLALDRVHVALSILVRRRCVIGSPSALFQLTDNGKDLLKIADAAERKFVKLQGP